jgi:hypothetical protein
MHGFSIFRDVADGDHVSYLAARKGSHIAGKLKNGSHVENRN